MAAVRRTCFLHAHGTIFLLNLTVMLVLGQILWLWPCNRQPLVVRVGFGTNLRPLSVSLGLAVALHATGDIVTCFLGSYYFQFTGRKEKFTVVLHRVRKLPYDFLSVINGNLGPVLHIF